jgi:hypothetical protein
MSKKLCKRPKDEKTGKSKYICKKCNLKAAREKHLCKPKEL